MSELLDWLFDTSFIPRARLYAIDPTLLWVQAVGDLLIALGAVLMATLMARVAGRRRGEPLNGQLVMFMALMFALGLSNVFEVWVNWIPFYRFSGIARLLTGLGALTTAILLIPALPHAFALSRALVGRAHGIDEKMVHTPAAEEFKKLSEELEQRVVERTSRLRETIQELKGEVAERKQTAVALKESEARFRAIIDASPLGIFLTDAEGGFIYTNRVYQNISAQSFGDALGEGWRTGLHPEDRDRFLSQWSAALAHGRSYESISRLLRKDGATVWVEVRAVPVRMGQALTGYMGTLDDVTESRRAEEALRASEERYRELFENANDIVFTADLEGHFTTMNKAGERLTGYSREEALRMRLSFEQLVAPEHRDLAREMLFYGPETETPDNYQLEILAKKGRRLGLEVSTRWMFQHGVRIGLQGIARDVTERKHLEDQLRQSQKMEAIGRLAGGVAHDFNNLLTAIMGYSDLLNIHISSGDPLRKYVDEIQKAGERAASLTGQLLAFSRKQPFSPRVISLSSVVSNMDRMLRRLIGEDVEIQTHADPSLGNIRADPGQMEQVMMNLVVNARDAMPDGGKLIIDMSNVQVDEHTSRTPFDVKPGKYVLLTVSDTGCGMDAETRSHIFEPFYTTKGPGKGTGLGLAIVYGIIQQSNGHISVQSEPGQGAKFLIYLPRVEEGLEVGSSDELLSAPPQGTETILLVEDQDEVRALAREVLQMAGYTVIEAGDGTEALTLNAAVEGDIQLLLTDVVMPRMSGWELSERITALRPGIKVLFMSGYSEQTPAEIGEMPEDAPFLQKPFPPAMLVRKVREILDGAPEKSPK